MRKPVLNRSLAWACVLSNLLVLPGLGTLTAGRRSGYAQAALGLIGFILTTGWCAWFIYQWIQLGELPESLGPYFGIALMGILLFVLGWSWALASSIAIVREANAQPEPPPPHRNPPTDRPIKKD